MESARTTPLAKKTERGRAVGSSYMGKTILLASEVSSPSVNSEDTERGTETIFYESFSTIAVFQDADKRIKAYLVLR